MPVHGYCPSVWRGCDDRDSLCHSPKLALVARKKDPHWTRGYPVSLNFVVATVEILVNVVWLQYWPSRVRPAPLQLPENVQITHDHNWLLAHSVTSVKFIYFIYPEERKKICHVVLVHDLIHVLSMIVHTQSILIMNTLRSTQSSYSEPKDLCSKITSWRR